MRDDSKQSHQEMKMTEIAGMHHASHFQVQQVKKTQQGQKRQKKGQMKNKNASSTHWPVLVTICTDMITEQWLLQINLVISFVQLSRTSV